MNTLSLAATPCLRAAAIWVIWRLLLVSPALIGSVPSVAQILGERAPTELNRVVAVVNDDVIVDSQLNRRLQTIRSQLHEGGTQPPPDEVLRGQVLERLVLEHVQLQLADRMGIRVDDETLNRAVAGVAKQNGLTVTDFRDLLERDGYSFADFREQVRDEIIVSRLQKRQLANRVRVTPQEIEATLAMWAKRGPEEQAYRLAHILIAVPEAASPEEIAGSRERADEALARLRTGEDFARLAAAVSSGQQALRGGDLGWRKASQLPTLFADTVPEMEIGELRGPIRSPSGFHIIKLTAAKGNQHHIITQTAARHIVVETDAIVSDEEAQTRLTQLKTRVENGENFADLARSHSDDAATAAKGGELGWLSPGDFPPDFEQQLDRLAPGDISEPFRTQLGWHLLQVTERRQHDDTDEVLRARARQQILQRKTEQELQTWLRQLRDEAYVELRLDSRWP